MISTQKGSNRVDFETVKTTSERPERVQDKVDTRRGIVNHFTMGKEWSFPPAVIRPPRTGERRVEAMWMEDELPVTAFMGAEQRPMIAFEIGLPRPGCAPPSRLSPEPAAVGGSDIHRNRPFHESRPSVPIVPAGFDLKTGLMQEGWMTP